MPHSSVTVEHEFAIVGWIQMNDCVTIIPVKLPNWLNNLRLSWLMGIKMIYMKITVNKCTLIDVKLIKIFKWQKYNVWCYDKLNIENRLGLVQPQNSALL